MIHVLYNFKLGTMGKLRVMGKLRGCEGGGGHN
jgi:hypothetical protein